MPLSPLIGLLRAVCGLGRRCLSCAKARLTTNIRGIGTGALQEQPGIALHDLSKSDMRAIGAEASVWLRADEANGPQCRLTTFSCNVCSMRVRSAIDPGQVKLRRGDEKRWLSAETAQPLVSHRSPRPGSGLHKRILFD